MVDKKEISRLCTKHGESAFSMYFITESHAYQLQFSAMHVYTAPVCLCACMRDAGTLPDMSKCHFLLPYLVVANRTYVFAREHSTHFPFVYSVLHQSNDGVCVASFAAFSWDAIAQKKCAFTNTETHEALTYWLASRHLITSIQFNSCRCDVM